MVTAWLIGPLFSKEAFADYFAEPHALLYPLMGILGGHAHVDFAASPFPDELNSSLCTIKYELLAYLVFGAASALGLLRSRFVSACASVLLGVGLTLVVRDTPVEGSVVENFVRFGFCFALGVMLFRFRDAIEIRPVAALVLFAVGLPLGSTPAGPVFWVAAWAYGALALASVRVPGLTDFANRWDISFGVYLYGWPTQQILMQHPAVHGSLVSLIAVSITGAMLVGWVSFVLVERPAMRRRGALANIIGRLTGMSPASPASAVRR